MRGRFNRSARRVAQRFVRQSILKAMPKRVLRDQITVTAAANAETRFDLFSVANDPATLLIAEAGSKLTMWKIDATMTTTADAGDVVEFAVFINRSNLQLTSANVIDDFWATTEPVTQNQRLIRTAMLKYHKIVIPATAITSHRFFFKKLWKRGLTLYDGDSLELVIKNSNASEARDFIINTIAVTRE